MQTYTNSEYLRLLDTYSNHLKLDKDCRDRLFEAVAGLSEQPYAGKVDYRYLSVVHLARRGLSA